MYEEEMSVELAAIKDELESIIGLPRAIPLFSEVTGNGNNAMFTVVGFAGIRIMEVKMTGAMSKKRVIIQPAFVVDDAGITGPGTIWLQSLPFSRLAGRIWSAAPQTGGRGKGEGSVLGKLGGIGGMFDGG